MKTRRAYNTRGGASATAVRRCKWGVRATGRKEPHRCNENPTKEAARPRVGGLVPGRARRCTWGVRTTGKEPRKCNSAAQGKKNQKITATKVPTPQITPGNKNVPTPPIVSPAAAAAATETEIKRLSNGTFGCVYLPELKCAKPHIDIAAKSGRMVSKLQQDDPLTASEVSVGAKVMRIPNYRAYFAPVVESCKLTKDQIPAKTKAFTGCPVVKSSKKDTDPFVLLTIPTVTGVTLHKHLSEACKNSPTTFLRVAQELYEKLSVSLAKLRAAHVVHFDLKGDNILFDAEKKVPIIIDFGVSLDVDVLVSQHAKRKREIWPAKFYNAAKNYGPWCLQIALISSLWEYDATDKVIGADGVLDLQTVIEMFYEDHPAMALIQKVKNKEWDAKLLFSVQRADVFVQSLLNKTRAEAALILLNQSWQSWDQRALASLFLPFLIAHGASRSKFAEELVDVLLL